MSRITHFKVQPKNIQYWDYYILCRLDTPAAIALQKLEYWDGTKEDGNLHAEDINDALEAAGEEATQMISRWFYKSQDELQWELMGATGEKGVANLTKFLTRLGYLEQRTNPDMPMDRKKQYHFNERIVQDHVSYLGFIIDYFKRAGHRLDPVYYAIERLTDPDEEKGGANIPIEALNIAHICKKLVWMYGQTDQDEAATKENPKYKPVLPKFIRIKLNKDRNLLPRLIKAQELRFRNFAEWKLQNCGMDSDDLRNELRKNAGAIAVTTNSNSNQQKNNASVAASPSDEKTLEEEKTYQQRAEYWQTYINERRGGPLRKSKEVKSETQSLLDLVKEFTDEQIAAIDKHLATESWKYKKNPCEIGGEALLNESRPTWSLIKDKVAPKRQVEETNGVAPAPVACETLQRNRELAAKYGLTYR